jgi:CheY-like chemotaxis protein
VRSAGRGQSSKPRRILVADDNRDSATTLGMLLRHSGHEVHLAHSGAEALEIANSWSACSLSSETARMRSRKNDLVSVRILNDCSADLIRTGHLIGRNSLLLEVIELFVEIRDRQCDG